MPCRPMLLGKNMINLVTIGIERTIVGLLTIFAPSAGTIDHGTAHPAGISVAITLWLLHYVMHAL